MCLIQFPSSLNGSDPVPNQSDKSEPVIQFLSSLNGPDPVPNQSDVSDPVPNQSDHQEVQVEEFKILMLPILAYRRSDDKFEPLFSRLNMNLRYIKTK